MILCLYIANDSNVTEQSRLHYISHMLSKGRGYIATYYMKKNVEGGGVNIKNIIEER